MSSHVQPLPVDRVATGSCGAATESLLMDPAQAADLAALFKALCDPTRVRLVAYLAAAEGGAVCSCHLIEDLGLSQPTVSHHLKKLVEAGVLTREQRGRWAHYAVVQGVLDVAGDFLRAPAGRALLPLGGCC